MVHCPAAFKNATLLQKLADNRSEVVSVGFLDNIENDLKAMEARQEHDPHETRKQREKRESERSAAAAIAPVADELRNGKFTEALLDHAVRIGHAVRTKVHMTWLGKTLRLQARDRRLDLEPTGKGVIAHFREGDQEVGSEPVDLKGNARELAERWLAGIASKSEPAT